MSGPLLSSRRFVPEFGKERRPRFFLIFIFFDLCCFVSTKVEKAAEQVMQQGESKVIVVCFRCQRTRLVSI